VEARSVANERRIVEEKTKEGNKIGKIKDWII